MATEGPLYVDGAQCQAAANYFNPGTTLYGLNGSGQFLLVTISAARTVALAGAATVMPYGILQNTPDIGQAASVAFGPSITKAVCGTTGIAAGVLLMADVSKAGTLILWAAGAHNFIVGQSLEAATAGAVFTMQMNVTLGAT